jgi:hypothetical protein
VELPQEIVAATEAVARLSNRSVEEVSRTKSASPPPPVEIVEPIDYSLETKGIEHHRTEYAGRWVVIVGDRLLDVGGYPFHSFGITITLIE